jgi:signal transduction histidine kinase
MAVPLNAMAPADVLDRLTSHRTLGAAPREQLVWLADHSALRRLEKGGIVAEPGGKMRGLMVLLSGHISVRSGRGVAARKVAEWYAGDVSGFLPYSRMSSVPGVVTAEEPLEFLELDRDFFPEMIRECHELTAICVHVMIDRARHFTSSAFHDEKLLSLGRLSAGLAHELNNPASAVVRSAQALGTQLTEALAAFRALGALRLPAETLRVLDGVADICVTTVETSVRSPIEQADREDALAEWLESRGADTAAAPSLADSAVEVQTLGQLADLLPGDVLNDVVRALAAGCATRKLTYEIENAATRIDGLVAAIKGFSYMDQATVPQPVDIGRGLTNTLTVMRNKARKKKVRMDLDVAPDLPTVPGYGGELNQVWGNLIENALDAAPEGGHVEITAGLEGACVVVRVIDDGPGIPEAIRNRVFEPFFTTKPVGSGTGLGLDISRRLVGRHDGSIEFKTQPGRTEFKVSLPTTIRVEPAGAAGETAPAS